MTLTAGQHLESSRNGEPIHRTRPRRIEFTVNMLEARAPTESLLTQRERRSWLPNSAATSRLSPGFETLTGGNDFYL
jgi:hypothetical protein